MWPEPSRALRPVVALAAIAATGTTLSWTGQPFMAGLAAFAAIWILLPLALPPGRLLGWFGPALEIAFALGLNAALWLLSGHPQALPFFGLNALLIVSLGFLGRQEIGWAPTLVSLTAVVGLPLLIVSSQSGVAALHEPALRVAGLWFWWRSGQALNERLPAPPPQIRSGLFHWLVLSLIGPVLGEAHSVLHPIAIGLVLIAFVLLGMNAEREPGSISSESIWRLARGPMLLLLLALGASATWFSATLRLAPHFEAFVAVDAQPVLLGPEELWKNGTLPEGARRSATVETRHVRNSQPTNRASTKADGEVGAPRRSTDEGQQSPPETTRAESDAEVDAVVDRALNAFGLERIPRNPDPTAENPMPRPASPTADPAEPSLESASPIAVAPPTAPPLPRFRVRKPGETATEDAPDATVVRKLTTSPELADTVTRSDEPAAEDEEIAFEDDRSLSTTPVSAPWTDPVEEALDGVETVAPSTQVASRPEPGVSESFPVPEAETVDYADLADDSDWAAPELDETESPAPWTAPSSTADDFPTTTENSLGISTADLDYRDEERIDLSQAGGPIGEFIHPAPARPPEHLYLRLFTYENLTPTGLQLVRRRDAPVTTPSPSRALPPFDQPDRRRWETWWSLRLAQGGEPWIPIPSGFAQIATAHTTDLHWSPQEHRIWQETAPRVFEVRFDRPSFSRERPALGNEDLDALTRLYPDSAINQRLKTLALEIAGRAGRSPRDFARRAVRHLDRRADYRLEVSIPPGPEPSLVRWLENSVDGYCEYFAGAFVLLARAYGIPARAVSGYSVSDYDARHRRFLIFPSNAHAWAEILDDGEWVRVEATPASRRYPALGNQRQFADFTLENEVQAVPAEPEPPASEPASEPEASPMVAHADTASPPEMPPAPAPTVPSAPSVEVPIEMDAIAPAMEIPVAELSPEPAVTPSATLDIVALEPPTAAEEKPGVATADPPPTVEPASPTPGAVATDPPFASAAPQPLSPDAAERIDLRWGTGLALVMAGGLFGLFVFGRRRGRTPEMQAAQLDQSIRRRSGRLLSRLEQISLSRTEAEATSRDALHARLLRLRYGPSPREPEFIAAEAQWQALRKREG